MTNENAQSNLLSQVQVTCREILATTVDKLKQKYRKEHYVARADPELVFQRFTESEKELFLVLGDSGHGKTNLMCHLGQLSIETRPTLLLMGMWRNDLQENIFDYIFNRLRASLGYGKTELWSFIRDLDEQLRRQQSWLLVIIDGINETEDPLWVKRGIRELLNNCPKTIRLAVSCRTDSFRLHFQDDFWANYVYQEGTPLEKLQDDTQIHAALKTRVKSRFERSLTPEQREAVENALAKAHRAQQLRRAKRLRELATEGSIFLSQFNELEFSTALSKYQITATLVGEALEQTHNPLVFRFFAETVGREAREVSDVFTLANADRYLKKHIGEIVAKGHDQNRVKQSLYRLASDCREDYFKGSNGASIATFKNPDDGKLIDNFLEAGLLISWGEAQSGKIKFTFDRVLSFVLAQQAVELGSGAITKRLSQLSRIQEPPAIDLHQCIYLLLFNEEARLVTDHKPDKDWIRVFLNKPAFRAQVIQLLPEFSSWSTTVILQEIKKLLLTTPSQLDREDFRPYPLQPVSELTRDLIKACGDALATMARKGHAPDVIKLVEEFLSYCPRKERTHVFHSLVTPIAVSFTNDPPRCMEILKQLCGSEDEIDLAVMISGPLESVDEISFFFRSRLEEKRSATGKDRNGISILQQEVSNFPQARLLLLMHLASSNWAVFRSIAANSLSRLFPTAEMRVRELIAKFADDHDFRVRASLAQTAAELAEFDLATASDLCMKLLDDRDERVRAALVHSIVDLSRQGDVKLDFLLTDALSDESTYIRSVLGTSLIDALSTHVLETTTEDLFKTCLRVLAKDKSYLVRSILATHQGTTPAKSPAFWIDLLLNALSDDAPPSFRILIIDSLVRSSMAWGDIPTQADRLAVEITKDQDASVRCRAVYLLTEMAEQGGHQAKESLNLLVDDPELLVRLETLKAHAAGSSEILSQAILRGGDKAHTANPRQRGLEPQYINALVDGKIKALRGRELIERFLRNVSAVGLLIPFLILTGITGWKVSWLGYLGDERYTSSPRHSFTPIIIGLFVATAVLHIQQWMDLHYYSRRTVTILKVMWPYLLVPILLSIAFAIASRHYIQTDVSLLIGLGTLTITIAISDLIFDKRHRLSSSPWSMEGIAYMLVVGYFSGVLGGWLAELTRESFYSFFMLVCPLFLSLRLNERYRTTILVAVFVCIPVSFIPLAVYQISAVPWSTHAHLYQWLANNFGTQAASAGLLATVIAVFFMIGSLTDDAEEYLLIIFAAFLLVLLGLTSLTSLSLTDSFLAATLVTTVLTAILRAIADSMFDRSQLGHGLVIFFSTFWLGLYAQPLLKSPWLLPGTALLVIAAYSILLWSYGGRWSNRDRALSETLPYYALRQAIKFSLVAVPTLCALAILAATALFSIANPTSSLSFTGISMALAVIFGLAVLYFHPAFDFGIRSRVLRGAIPTVFVVALAACSLFLVSRQRVLALIALGSAGLFNAALLVRVLLRAKEKLPLVVAVIVIPPICLLVAFLHISIYIAYLVAFLVLLSMWSLLSRKTTAIYSWMDHEITVAGSEGN